MGIVLRASAGLKKRAIMLAGISALTILPAMAQAQADIPHAPVSWSGGAGIAEFHIDGDTAQISLRTPDAKVVVLRSVNNVSDALIILADQRLSFAWPALLAWAGDDLHMLRDKALVRAERAFRDGRPLGLTEQERAEPWGKQFSAFRQYISVLESSGQAAYAITRIEAELAHPTLHDDVYLDIRTQLQIMLADRLFEAGEIARATQVLFKASADAQWPGSRENANINAALLLAMIGKYDWALKIGDGSDYDGRQEAAARHDKRLPDGDADYAAIRACALDGLGRKAEAQAVLATIVPAPKTSTELSTNGEARRLAVSCMHDAAGLADYLAAQIAAAPPAADVLLEFQPARVTWTTARKTLVAALATDELTRAMAGRVRILGGDLVPALSGWMDGLPRDDSTNLQQLDDFVRAQRVRP